MSGLQPFGRSGHPQLPTAHHACALSTGSAQQGWLPILCSCLVSQYHVNMVLPGAPASNSPPAHTHVLKNTQTSGGFHCSLNVTPQGDCKDAPSESQSPCLPSPATGAAIPRPAAHQSLLSPRALSSGAWPDVPGIAHCSLLLLLQESRAWGFPFG